mmetsp:Transcript_80942/g.247353  ORF Transcript_80942/g.247353 Transcript_80942/m.247353 type:complete len:251 (+) Transcript_80942:366-1118(+)
MLQREGQSARFRLLPQRGAIRHEVRGAVACREPQLHPAAGGLEGVIGLRGRCAPSRGPRRRRSPRERGVHGLRRQHAVHGLLAAGDILEGVACAVRALLAGPRCFRGKQARGHGGPRRVPHRPPPRRRDERPGAAHDGALPGHMVEGGRALHRAGVRAPLSEWRRGRHAVHGLHEFHHHAPVGRNVPRELGGRRPGVAVAERFVVGSGAAHEPRAVPRARAAHRGGAVAEGPEGGDARTGHGRGGRVRLR